MIVEYDYNTFTDKDMFEVKLKDIVPDFGYIASSKRAIFLKEMARLRFVVLIGSTNYNMGYKVLQSFAYETMGVYRPKMVVTEIDEYLIFDKRNRPNEHIKQNWSQDKKDEWLVALTDKGEDDE